MAEDKTARVRGGEGKVASDKKSSESREGEVADNKDDSTFELFAVKCNWTGESAP